LPSTSRWASPTVSSRPDLALLDRPRPASRTAALGALSAVWVSGHRLIFGVTVNEGIIGVLTTIALVTLTAVAIGGIGAAIALRTGSSSVVQGPLPAGLRGAVPVSAFFPQN